MKIDSLASFEDLMLLLNSLPTPPSLIAQEFVETSTVDGTGHDLRILVVGGKVIGSFERVGKKGSFKANIALGGHLRQIPITDEITRTATAVAAKLGLDYAGIDLLYGKTNLVVCEANSAADFNGILEASHGQVDVADAIIKHVLTMTTSYDSYQLN